MSFDLSTDRGWLVPPSLRGRWEPVVESTMTALPDALRGRRVGLIIHDSAPTYECEEHELRAAINNAAERLVMVCNGDWSTALRDVCAETEARYATVRERPTGHFYPGASIALGVLDAPITTDR
jgi:hypothetical protein